MSLPIAQQSPPRKLECLQCHLLGRKKLLCGNEESCRHPPSGLPLGPAILAGWIALVLAFVLGTR